MTSWVVIDSGVLLATVLPDPISHQADAVFSTFVISRCRLLYQPSADQRLVNSVTASMPSVKWIGTFTTT